ncbi:MAG: hypothetical protein HY537_07785 [Deltaproteobacteria bacterium]|nr:hypothetical protein [Deltaproteobacteria bacterium]
MSRLFLLLVAFLSGCAHVQKKQFVPMEERLFWQDQQTRQSELSNLSASVEVLYEGDKEKLRGKGKFVGQLPDRFHLMLHDMLGRSQYVLNLLGNQCIAHYPTEKLTYVDPNAGRTYIRRWMETELSLVDFYHLLLGIFSSKPSHFSSWKWDERQGLYCGLIHLNSIPIEVFVDPKMSTIHSIKFHYPKNLVTIRYSDFTPQGNFWFAHSVRFESQLPSTIIEIQWEDVAPWKPHGTNPFDYPVPHGSQTIILKEPSQQAKPVKE